jgi:hypothetical protein
MNTQKKLKKPDDCLMALQLAPLATILRFLSPLPLPPTFYPRFSETKVKMYLLHIMETGIYMKHFWILHS